MTMKRLVLSLGVALSPVILTAQNTHPDFSGSWRQDTARTAAVGGGTGNRESAGGGRGGGLGLGPPADELLVTQTSTTLTIVERRGTADTRIVYALDGKRQTNTVSSGRNSGATAVYISQWKDGRIETRLTMRASPDSKDTVEYLERRSLNADGTMVIETTMPGRPNSRRLVYEKTR